MLSKVEEDKLQELESKYYMVPILVKFKETITRLSEQMDTKQAWILIWDELHNIMVDSKSEVDVLLEERKSKGIIRDVAQARKTIAGSGFSNLFVYTFLKNKSIGNIGQHIFITDKTKNTLFSSIITVEVDGETQKPDMDLIIYSEQNKSISKCMIFSLKTSLRERAGQTYRWKLLMEIAQTEGPLRDKYGIRYAPTIQPLVCFATINFYNEIHQPQHRGMFKFFDKSFIAKSEGSELVSPLSRLITFLTDYFQRDSSSENRE